MGESLSRQLIFPSGYEALDLVEETALSQARSHKLHCHLKGARGQQAGCSEGDNGIDREKCIRS